MPRRLRVSFSPQLFLTLQCSPGAFSRTGVAAQLNYVPVSVSADVWTKLSTVLSFGDTRSGPYIGQGWTRGAVDTNTGRIFLAQGNPSQGAQYGNFFFNPSLGYWTRTNTVTGDWHRNPLGIMENYDLTYNPDANTFHRTSGGPFGGSPYNTAGPFYGDSVYNATTDEWSTPYPSAGNTYTPVPADSGYFGALGNSLEGFDSALKYYNGALYQFGGLSAGPRQDLKKRVLSTGVISTLIPYTAGPPFTSDTRSTQYLRSSLDSRFGRLHAFANNMAYYTCDLNATTPVWTAITTTGTVPSTAAPSGALPSTSTDFGIVACLDEHANCMVAWVGINGAVNADAGTSQRKTWIMDLATREWRAGPSLAGGYTVPPAQTAVAQSLLYDPVGKRTLLYVGQGFPGTEVWALQIAPIGGKITSWPLPASVGSTYGTTYYGFPFLSNGGSKHVNMAYCPLNGRLYASGGDTQVGSATDGTWSMSLSDGSWRLDVGRPVYGSVVAPHAYQDGCLFQWMPSRNKFVFGFGGCFGYEADGSAIYNYSSGYWFYDPIANVWEQQVGFFTNPTLSHAVNGTGNEFGGVYDEVTDSVYVLGDSSAGAYARRYNLTTGAYTTYAYTLPPSGVSGFTAAYFIMSRLAQIGRYIYTLGYYTNGVNRLPANVRAAMWRWGIDDHTFVRMASPPEFTALTDTKELVLCASNGKLVHPRRYGPEGTMPEGVYVYNPANDTWTQDTKTPAYGTWIQNSVCALPDGRVAMSGGAFGSQQTHMWFYEAT